VKKTAHKKPGSSIKWESITLEIISRYEKRFADRMPALELRSRVLEKLRRARFRSQAHLAVLVSKIANQVLLDHVKEQSRHYRHFVYVDAFDWPAPETGLPQVLKERLEDLLGPDSPLSGADKALVQIALDEPNTFIQPDGQVNQTRLGKHLGLDQTTVGWRWQRILEKIEAWRQGQMDLPL
jgi:DNA-directed RNA polymerase specialized sigma24 family protein